MRNARRTHALGLLWATVGILAPPTGLRAQTHQFEIGLNLAGIRDYSSEIVFRDAGKMIRWWTTYNAGSGSPWSTDLDDKLYVDGNGYPLQIPQPVSGHPDQAVRGVIAQEYRPSARYVFLYDGEARLSIHGNGWSVVEQAPGRIVLDHMFGGSGWYNLTYSKKDDHFRNVRVLPIELENSYDPSNTGHLFFDKFTERVKPFRVFRFMDWGSTNHSPVTTWESRTTPSTYTQTVETGMCLEHMIAFANHMMAEPWFCIPAMADDDYIRRFAALVRDNLNPALKFYVEYSNELWNGQFSQTDWLRTKACADPITHVDAGGNDWGVPGCADNAAAEKYVAKRNGEIWSLMCQELGDDKSRMVKVLGGWGPSASYNDDVLTYLDDPVINPGGIDADAIAINSYFGNSLEKDHANLGTLSVDAVLDLVAQAVESDIGTRASESRAVADKHGVKLFTYEGGQHLVASDSDALTDKFIAVNRHPRMKDLYARMFEIWHQNRGDLFVMFSSIGLPDKWGSWGILEHTTQPTDSAPKYQAALEAIQMYSPEVGNSVPHRDGRHRLSGHPSVKATKSMVEVVSRFNGPVAVELIDVAGRRLRQAESRTGTVAVHTRGIAPGTYLFRVRTRCCTTTETFVIP